MNEEQFNNLLEKVTPTFSHTNTLMRDAISFKVKLEIALRYLATGDSLKSLEFLYRMPKNYISFCSKTLLQILCFST
nr:unnamed protein product [Callosobruchus chinensis]